MNIHICAAADFDCFEGLPLLTPERQTRVSRYRQHADKLRCLCGGLLLRFLLGDKAKDVCPGKYGKPVLPDGKIYFNLSHSGEYIVLASDTDEIGIDIEKIRTIPKGVAEHCFTPDELEWMIHDERPEKTFYRLWTAKESIMKATGEGFRLPPKTFSVMPVENGIHRILDQNWYVQWCEFDRHQICAASKTPQPATIRFLNKKELIV